MKKLFAVAAALLLAISANAQVGIIAGLTTTATDYSTAISTAESVNQYHVGIAFKLPIGAGFELQPAVVYDVKGATVKEQLAGNNVFDTKTGYIEVPIQIQWGIDLSSKLRAFAFGEPYVAYAIDIQNKIGTGDWAKVADWDGIKRLQYGVGAGIGVELLGVLQLTARYYWDMGNMYDGDGNMNEISYKTVSETLKNSKSSGIKISLAHFF